ncbi:MAG TPA: thioredoxin family protein [Kiritimatiellia bacterium]|nr:thioredoxin family protein [Kiritimatiellia bacterium]
MKMKILGLVVGWLTAVAGAASALQVKDYDEASFKQVLEQGGTAVLEFNAPWCGTCKRQGAVLEALAGQAELAHITVFKVDFDSAKDLRKTWGVKKQSTLVLVGAGGDEVARSMGETNPERIRAFLAKATP